MKAIVVHETGGPEVLRHQDWAEPVAGPGEALVKVEAAGVNFLDIYYRSGFHWGGHHQRPLPYIPGAEGAGVVVAVGEGVTEAAVGDRVAFGVSNGQGAYAEIISVASLHLAQVPDAVSLDAAGAVMQQGMTAHYLSHDVYSLKAGDVALVHAAAGGTGLLLTQMATLRGARVIGVVSSAAKVEAARRAGADAVIVSPAQDFLSETRRLTGGDGVTVVYDSVGQATFDQSLDCLRPRGMMVLYGQSSGAVPPLDTAVLNAKGSLMLARPSLTHYAGTHADVTRRAADLFGWIGAGALDVHVGTTLPLSQAAQAHILLASRTTTGKLILKPGWRA